MSPFSSEGEDHTYPSSPMLTRPLLPPERNREASHRPCAHLTGSEGVVGPGGSRGGAVTENCPPPQGSWLGAAWTLEVNSFSDGDPARVSQ